MYIVHGVGFCKKRAPFHASNCFSFELYSIANDKNEYKQFFYSFNIRAVSNHLSVTRRILSL